MLADNHMQLDRAIMASISKGWTTVGALSGEAAGLWPMVAPLRMQDPWRGGLTPVSHIMAKRLQELRKQGLIVYEGKGWGLTSLGEKELMASPACAVTEAPRPKAAMKDRIDVFTAQTVDVAIRLKTMKGTLAAARFLDRHQIPAEIVMRALSITTGHHRPVFQ